MFIAPLSITNPFQERRQARRYHEFRPRYHAIAFAPLAAHLRPKPTQVLDVACGTGHSTSALAQVFPSVVGCDASDAMLAEARASFDLPFVQGQAEHLPFPDASFDLVNVSMGFHWFAQDQFLREARRVLRSGGHLSIENYGFLGRIKDNGEFEQFNRDFYKTNFPNPPRNPNHLSDEQMAEFDFSFLKDFHYEHWLAMNFDQFVGFLLTQSNLILANKGDLELLLRHNYEQYFDGVVKELHFGGLLKLYRLA